MANDTSNPTGWVWRFSNERYDKKMVNITNHGQPDFTIMIWGAIWLGGRSEIVIMVRDSDSAGNGYTSWSYIEALKQGLLPVYQPGTFFQQDNAKIHVSRATQSFFEEHGI